MFNNCQSIWPALGVALRICAVLRFKEVFARRIAWTYRPERIHAAGVLNSRHEGRIYAARRVPFPVIGFEKIGRLLPGARARAAFGGCLALLLLWLYFGGFRRHCVKLGEKAGKKYDFPGKNAVK